MNQKTFYLQDNIGTSKYTVSYHDGESTNKDGSRFFGIRTFKNKKKRDLFIAGLKKQRYTER